MAVNMMLGEGQPSAWPKEELAARWIVLGKTKLRSTNSVLILSVLIQMFLTGLYLGWQQWTILLRRSGVIARVCLASDDLLCIDESINLLYLVATSADQLVSVGAGVILLRYGNRVLGVSGIILHCLALSMLAICDWAQNTKEFLFVICFGLLGCSTNALNFSLLDSANRVPTCYRLIAISGILSAQYLSPIIMNIPLKIADRCSLGTTLIIWMGCVTLPLVGLYLIGIEKREHESGGYSIVMGGSPVENELSFIQILSSTIRDTSFNLGSLASFKSRPPDFGSCTPDAFASVSTPGYNNDVSNAPPPVPEEESAEDWLQPGDVILPPGDRAHHPELPTCVSNFTSFVDGDRRVVWAEITLLMTLFMPGAVVSNNYYWMTLYERTNERFVINLGWVTGIVACVIGFAGGFIFDLNPPGSIIGYMGYLIIAGIVPHLTVKSDNYFLWWIGGLLASISLSSIYTSRFSYLRTRSPMHYGLWAGMQSLCNGLLMLLISVFNYRIVDRTMIRCLVIMTPIVQTITLAIVVGTMYIISKRFKSPFMIRSELSSFVSN